VRLDKLSISTTSYYKDSGVGISMDDIAYGSIGKDVGDYIAGHLYVNQMLDSLTRRSDDPPRRLCCNA